MNLIVDENIVFAKEAFSSLGNTQLVDGRKLTNADVKDADILVVSSITIVNENFLKNSKVKFVGTATIGTDHIDLDYLNNQEITFADANGCNADSVAEYVFTALLKIASEKNNFLKGKTIGVVGVGNIGSRVVRLAKSLGIKVLRNDPPLQRFYKDENFISLEEILQADIITLHVPLLFESNDKTFHLLNENNLKRIKRGAIIINTSRGGVVDNSALLTESISREFDLVLDVWEDEPRVNPELLNKTKIATPHIAGYSFEGKVNGTKMIYDTLCKFLDVKPSWRPDLPKIQDKEMRLSEGKSDEEKLNRLFSSIYDIEKDDKVMRKILTYDPNERAKYFDLLRKKYPGRREFNNYSVQISGNDIHLKSFLENFRFTVEMI